MTYFADGAVAINSWAVFASIILNDSVELTKNTAPNTHATSTTAQKITTVVKNLLPKLPLSLGGALLVNLYINPVDSCELLAAGTLIGAGTLLLSNRSVKISLVDGCMDFFARLVIAAGATLLFQTNITTK